MQRESENRESNRGALALSLLLAMACNSSEDGGTVDDGAATGSTSQTSGAQEDEQDDAADDNDDDSPVEDDGNADQADDSADDWDDAADEAAEDDADSADEGGDDDAPIPSAGCGGSTLLPGEHLAVSIEFDGAMRSYDLFVPAAHDGVTPVPLVLNFHGFGGGAGQQANSSQMSATAAVRGFAVAYPAGIGSSWNAGVCCGPAKNGDVDDVGFTRALVEQLGVSLCLDERRVYATGMSNGGFLSHRLACEAADIIAAIGPVSGPLGIPAGDCNPTRPVPVIHTHGTEDNIVPYDGGGLTGNEAVATTITGWAARNGCDAEPQVTFEMDDVRCESWPGCADGSEVVLCTVTGGGHCWPGESFCLTGFATATIEASEVIADFFEKHRL